VKVVSTFAPDAGYLSPGDDVLIYGGAYFPPPYVSNEINHIISVERRSGVISLAEALEKPLPAGVPGTRPSILKLNGNIVTDVSLSSLSISNYSGGFFNTSAIDRISMSDIAMSMYGNSDVWTGYFRRHWSISRSTLVGSQELDMDEDFSFDEGVWSDYSGGIFASEGSSNIRFMGSHLSYDELMCQDGVVCVDHSSGFSSQVSVNRFALVGNTIKVNENLDNEKEDNWAIAIQGGRIGKYIGEGDEISDNTIVTNARYGIVIEMPLDQKLHNNRLTMTTVMPTMSFPIRAPEIPLSTNEIVMKVRVH
jgi:hypothetical protein